MKSMEYWLGAWSIRLKACLIVTLSVTDVWSELWRPLWGAANYLLRHRDKAGGDADHDDRDDKLQLRFAKIITVNIKPQHETYFLTYIQTRGCAIVSFAVNKTAVSIALLREYLNKNDAPFIKHLKVYVLWNVISNTDSFLCVLKLSRRQKSIKFSEVDSRRHVGTNSVPIFRVCWWFVRTKTDDQVSYTV